MKSIVLFTLLGLLVGFTVRAHAQDREARPAVGWDSLKSLIVYPELARRALYEPNGEVIVQLDSLGGVKDVRVCAPEILLDPIASAVRSAKWLPEVWHGRRQACSVQFGVRFLLRGHPAPEHRVLDVVGEPIPPSKARTY